MTVPTVRIDDEVYDELKKKAEPFVDTPNTVLRRLLGLDPASVDGEVPVGVDDESGPTVASPPATGRQRKAESRKSKARPRSARGKRGPKRTRAPSGDLLPEERYELPLLRALVERGGSAPAREVVDAVGRALNGDLTDVDRQRLRSGGIRWENRVQFVRLRLIERGLIAKDSPRGVWAITDEGRQYAEASHA